MDFLSLVKKHIQKNGLISRGDCVIVGVSGGPDSIALSFILNSLRHELGISLHLAHLNHGLRKSADTDEQFVKRFAATLNIPLTTKKIDLRKHTTGSIEEWARHYRFQFLIETAKKKKGDTIALAHTRDDLAETVLMRLLRGTGMAGLRAILPKRTIEGMSFIRPLLIFSKAEVLAFLKSRRLKFRLDQSNRSTKFFRNKIRLKLLPLLEKEYNPNTKELLANCAETIGQDYEYLEESSRKHFGRWIVPQKNSIRLPLDKLQNLPLSLQRILIRLSVERLKGNLNTLTLTHMKEIEDLLSHRPRGAIVHLPQKLKLQKDKRFLTISFVL